MRLASPSEKGEIARNCFVVWDTFRSLKTARGKGRDDYRVRKLWSMKVLTAALRRTSVESCRGELRRHPSLAKLAGIVSGYWLALAAEMPLRFG